MEQLIVIAVFAICAAICVNTFVGSYLMTMASKNKNGALLAVESCAESYKAVSGDLRELAAVLDGNFSDNTDTLVVYYDKKWQVCVENEAVYTLLLTPRLPDGDIISPVLSDLSVNKITGEEITSLTVTARRWEYE